MAGFVIVDHRNAGDGTEVLLDIVNTFRPVDEALPASIRSVLALMLDGIEGFARTGSASGYDATNVENLVNFIGSMATQDVRIAGQSCLARSRWIRAGALTLARAYGRNREDVTEKGAARLRFAIFVAFILEALGRALLAIGAN